MPEILSNHSLSFTFAFPLSLSFSPSFTVSINLMYVSCECVCSVSIASSGLLNARKWKNILWPANLYDLPRLNVSAPPTASVYTHRTWRFFDKNEMLYSSSSSSKGSVIHLSDNFPNCFTSSPPHHASDRPPPTPNCHAFVAASCIRLLFNSLWPAEAVCPYMEFHIFNDCQRVNTITTATPAATTTITLATATTTITARTTLTTTTITTTTQTTCTVPFQASELKGKYSHVSARKKKREYTDIYKDI